MFMAFRICEQRNSLNKLFGFSLPRGSHSQKLKTAYKECVYIVNYIYLKRFGCWKLRK